MLKKIERLVKRSHTQICNILFLNFKTKASNLRMLLQMKSSVSFLQSSMNLTKPTNQAIAFYNKNGN